MAEIFLSATIQVVFEKLLSPELVDFERREGVHTAVKKWKEMLIKIREVLDDAEEKQITMMAVKRWLDEVRDLVYDVEDILDAFDTEALRQASTSSEVRSLIPTSCTSFNPSAVLFNFRLGSKIREITSRLQDIVSQKRDLELGKNAGKRSNRTRERRETGSTLTESEVYGREKDKEAMLELMRSEASDNKVFVIPILGMAGVGKTTLAQLVYNDDKVKGNFDLRAWVYVSEESSVIQVTKGILQSFTLQTSDINDLDSLQVRLKEIVSKKKFLLVLDDVWHEDYDNWTILRTPLQAGAPGSKIIVTTRNQGVSSIMHSIPAYPLKELSNDDCLSIFTQHALGTSDFDAHPNLKQIGEQIVKRCKGLPLAAKAFGGLLCNKEKLDEWEDVLNSKMCDLPEERSGILPALRLSYRHLPSHLKQCFAYCSIFPKDYEFEEEEFVLLWMAAGLVQRSEMKQMEDKGGECFRELLSRSLFQQSSINHSRFVMHDLINELAQWAAGVTCFRLEGKKQCKISKRARHLSYVGSKCDGVKKFEAFDEVKCLRTFLPLMTPKGSYLTTNVLNLLPKLRCLRVLSLSGYCITKLPSSIGDLKHLRFLDLSCTRIRSLPKSTSTLYNLQTLMLKNCSRLEKLPIGISNLINLRHLDIEGADSIKKMPPGVGKLISLRKLSNFIVDSSSGSGIRELMNIKSLRGTLCISGLENVIDARDAREANLKDKQDLDVLTMEWSSDFNASRNEIVEKEVLDMLLPHKKLKELTIKYYGGMRFPNWLGDPSFSNMVVLSLVGCEKCTYVPPLGQLPLLKDLCIGSLNGVNRVDHEFYGEGCQRPFPLLENLRFEYMLDWEDWEDLVPSGVEVLPRLHALSIIRCPKLQGRLPRHLCSLEKLFILECPKMTVSISNLPNLCELNIQGCQEVEHRSTNGLSSLKTMVLSDISKLTCPTEGLFRGLTSIEDLQIVDCWELTSLWQNEAGLLQNLTSLRHLKTKGCPEFVSLVAEEIEQQQHHMGVPCTIESLELSGDDLEMLPGFHGLASLKEVTIKECPRLRSFPEKGLPSLLIDLRIECCKALISLPQAMMHRSNYASLNNLLIDRCDSVMSIARGQLPSTLKKLEIRNCKNLQSLLDDEEDDEEGSASSSFASSLMMHKRNRSSTSLLEHLRIKGCPSLVSLLSRASTLKYLYVDGCPELESLAEKLHNNTFLEIIQIGDCKSLKFLPEGLHSFTQLCELALDRCPSLVSFPVGGLPSANLKELRISLCEKLKVLPDGMHKLNSLLHLKIWCCPVILSFPEEGFATNLTSFEIKDLRIFKLLFEWGFDKFTSLQHLNIEGQCPDLVSFPEEEKGMMLPKTLTRLSIRGFLKLKYLSSKGFQNLTSLEELCISGCPKLKSFPKKGLPPSLLQLCIYECPLLQQRCKKDQGQYWSMIAHIPCVKIDHKLIFDPEDEEEE